MDRLEVLAETFGGNLKPADREKFESTTFDDMRRAIGEIQSSQHRHRVMMNMNRLRLFLAGMEKLQDVLTELKFAVTGKVMAYVWGSIRFLLEKTNQTDRAFDKVLDVYEQLGAHIPQVLQYKRLFDEFADSQECLVYIYEDIQRFHLLAYQLFSLRNKLWQRLHKHVWKDFGNTFKQVVRSLDSHEGFLKAYGVGLRDDRNGSDADGDYDGMDRQLGAENPVDWDQASTGFARYRVDLKESWEDFADQETERKRQQRAKINAWISSSNKVEEMQKKFQNMRICDDSGRWIFRKYRGVVSDWMREEDASEPGIWLHGKKGFGKSMLASLIVDELGRFQKKRVIPTESKIYYFFCQEDDDDHCTHLNILKGILSQMVAADDYVLPLCEDKMTNGGRGDTLANAETAQTLIEAFIEHSPRQYIVIDGLDECDITEARQTAEFFKGQVKKYNREVSGQVAGGDGDTEQGRLRVLYMSQPIPELKGRLPKENASIELKGVDNRDDIYNYVKKRVPEFSVSGDSRGGFNLEDADKEQMVGTICQQSEGKSCLSPSYMFLHAHLTVEYLLQQQTKGHIRDNIKQNMLPEKLSEIYEKLLGSLKKRISDEEGNARWDKSKLLLGWLVCAKRPLKWHEMQAILAFDPDHETVDLDNNMLRHNVRKYLGSLVHILDGGHVRLIHSTARRYIVHNRYINEGEVQCKLAALCLKYLSLSCFTSDYNEIERKEDARRGWFSFQDYACSQWHSHVDTVIMGCNSVFHTHDAREEFAGALRRFVDTHGGDLATAFHTELPRHHVDKFQDHPFHKNLLRLWNHIFTHQKGPSEARTTIGIQQLDEALLANRTVLESHFTPSDRAVHLDTIEDYYGPNLFKCRRTTCRFFHVGYGTKRARDEHYDRHDRPYPCPLTCKSAPIGFSTAKDRDRHVRIYHPELGEGLSRFKALNRRQASGRFTCRICSETFTRKVNLQGHERSHFGDRPYACSACGKAFARVNDCRRHEKIHAKRRLGA